MLTLSEPSAFKIFSALRLVCEGLSEGDATMGFRVDDGVIVVTAMDLPKPRQNAEAAARTKKTREALRHKVQVSFEDSSLSAIVEHLRNVAGVNIVVHEYHLDNHGIDLDSSVRIRAKDIPVGALLRLVLEQINVNDGVSLGYRVDDGVVVITAGPKAPPKVQITTELQFYLSTPEDYRILFQPLLVNGENNKQSNIVLNTTEGARLIRRINAHPNTRRMSAPRLTVIENQPGWIAIGKETSYISGYKKNPRSADGPLDPVIDVAWDGLKVHITAGMKDGLKNLLTMDVDMYVTSKVGPIKKLPFRNSKLFTETPQRHKTRVSGRTLIRAGEVYLIDGGELVGKLDGEKNVAYHQRRHVILLATASLTDP